MPKKFGRSSDQRPNRRKRKSFQGNQFTSETNDTFVSTSAKKLKNADYDEIEVDITSNYVICHFLTIFNFLSQCLVCKSCHKDVKFTRISAPGVAFKLVVQCSCETRQVPSSPRVKTCYEVNRRLMFALRILGLGYKSLTVLCSLMDITHTFSNNMYYSFLSNLLNAVKAVFEQVQQRTVKEEIKLNTEAGNTPSHLSVSGDGSWKRRGFSSLFGIASLIGKYSKKIIDVVVKSSYCQACANWKSKQGTAEFIAWQVSHEEECTANHKGSAGKMEVDAMKEMFERSEELLGIKYATYIGDGDTKTFKALLDLDPYNGKPKVQKKECVGHVEKRHGTRLRNVKTNVKGLGGKGAGKLTEKVIKDLTLYYGLAIRRNSDSAEKMEEAIWATYYHKCSSDKKPQHHFCPKGVTSWCKWRVAEAEGTLADFKHKPPFQENVQAAIKPVYTALTQNELLARCVGGNTQNSNESFNATVWKLAPKHLHCGSQTVTIATYIATNIFNEGWSSVIKTINVLGIAVGLEAKNYAKKADSTRITKAEDSLSSSARAALIAKQQQRIAQNEQFEEEEGVMYGAGIAD